MKFEGKMVLNSRREDVWNFISEPSKVIECVPGLEEYSVEEGKRVTAKVKVSIGFIKGTFRASSSVVKEDHQNYTAKLKLSGSGVGSGFDALVDLKLNELEYGTEFIWLADVNVSGPLGSLAKPMLEGYVRKIVDQLFDCIKRKLTNSTI
ncbi:MAG: SRPBCC domain-containing protein [Aigarchaeota archaeon]|nr:SRPBCC domain-containing protein [Aigarchaeota archaeon]MCX8192877.1 SRPBCC domain-containing protein [Nitrososphaeria archaeon]MDW7986478.1 SRPBCC domain-containing protein [Nitrososphaerota archaeon]